MMYSLRKTIKNMLKIVGWPFYALVFYLAGVRYDRSWILHGLPFVRCGGKGSRISIGKRWVACSREKHNSIGISQRIMIRTCSPRAVIEIGDDVGMSGCVISACMSITIGSRVLIGSGALIMDSDFHSLDIEARFQGDKGLPRAVVIGDDVFIGARAIVLKGVHIGRGAVVGAGAVVTKDVGEFELVAGNPAQVVRILN